MLLALYLLALGTADAACCKQPLTYTVTTPSFNFNFASTNYPGDTLSNGLNVSIAVVAGCPVIFTLNQDSIHPFDIRFIANNTGIPGFTQSQTSGSVTWNVPSGSVPADYYKYQCLNHASMHNSIRVLDECIMDMPVSCDDYCMNISTICTGSNAQFPNPDSKGLCMASCMYYPDNATLSMSGDSYQCRNYNLGRASTATGSAKMTYCNAAGFNGGAGSCVTCAGSCGSFCDSYCDNIMMGCMGANAVFASRDDCMRECGWYPRDMAFNLSSPMVAGGDSVDCRSWHSQVAVNVSGDTAANMLHCGHASPQGGGACGTGCENYCDTVMTVCKNDLMQWNDRTQCLDACMTWPGQTDITWATTIINSINDLPCRKYHAGVAGKSSTLAQTHCIHSGPLGGTVCGTGCEGLCNIAVAACPSDISASNCANMCMNLTSSDGNATTTILNAKVPKGSVGCATYWSLKALAKPDLCPKVTEAMMAGAGGMCASAATLVKASWAIIAVMLLALGFTS